MSTTSQVDRLPDGQSRGHPLAHEHPHPHDGADGHAGGESLAHAGDMARLQHGHTFGQELRRPGESRTLVVIGITAVMMTIEIIAGLLFGSMALLADGLHMGSHAAALTVSAAAYIYARRQAHNTQFAFGTGKVNALGGYSGAVLLVVFAGMMAWESFGRLINPVQIAFDQAVVVAVVGLVVNLVCVFVLGAHDHTHDLDEGHGHTHDHDHNLKSASLHVTADALTSVLAIVALLSAKYFGFIWMDAVMGIVGTMLVAQWSIGLMRVSAGVLLDRQGPESIRHTIRECIEADQHSQVTDLHVWSIGPNIYSAVIAVASRAPATPETYKACMPKNLGLAHVSIEVHEFKAGAGELERVLATRAP